MSKELKTADPCPHDISEQDVAAQVDGLCPLCLQSELAKAREIIRPFAEAVSERGVLTEHANHDAYHAAWNFARAQPEKR